MITPSPESLNFASEFQTLKVLLRFGLVLPAITFKGWEKAQLQNSRSGFVVADATMGDSIIQEILA